MRRRRANPEQAIQRAVFQHFSARGAPGAFAFAVPNGGGRYPIEAKIMNGLGVRAGVPDICAIHQGKAYFLELKADGGKLSEHQHNALELLHKAGATAGVAIGLDQALNWLEVHGLLRGRAA